MSKRSHIAIALTTGLLATAALPAAANASITYVQYDVEAQATLQHKHGYLFTTSWEQATTNVDLNSKLRSKIGTVTFRDGHLFSSAQGPATAESTGTAKGTHTSRDGSGSRACTPAPGAKPSGQGTLEEEQLTPLGAAGLNVRVADDVAVDWSCTGDPQVAAMPSYPMTSNPGTVGAGSLDAGFQIPHEAIGYGKIIQNIAGPGGAFCAGAELPHTTSCQYSWTGQVTLTKTGETVIPTGPDGRPVPPSGSSLDDLIVPLVPTGSSKGKPSLDDLLVPLVPASAAKTDAKGSSVSFTASCPSGCAGSATLTVGGGAKASAKRGKPAATLRFGVKAGKPRTVKLRMPKKAARALRRARTGRLAVTLKPRRGKSVTRTLTVKVPKR